MFRCDTVTALLLCCLLGPVWPAIGAARAPASTNDIRILIDVSGSMKQNDPDNLRRPALRLLTGLLNDHNNAGVWTFGRYINMLVPPGRVDAAWKTRARAASKTIASHGLYTNIEGALRDATWDWSSVDKQHQRSLILLTDGLVDVAEDSQLDQASRSRILDEILPKIQAANIHIHTIALSDTADITLLQQMSRATQGSFTRVASAAELERVFLRLFEASSTSDSLPLNDNTVQVDNSIEEMTLLIFHKPQAKPTRILTPTGQTLTRTDKPAQTNWHAEKDYDLITIQHPAAGTWKVLAKTDPDNRVVVVTDLQLTTDPLPANLSVNDRQTIDIRLSEKGKTVINRNFLHFIKVTATEFDARNQQQRTWTLLDNGLHQDSRANDGIYTLALDTPLTSGRHDLVITVDGTTFTRQKRLSFEAFAQPVITSIETDTNGAMLFISPVDGLIDADSLRISASIDNEQATHTPVRSHENEWTLPLSGYDLNQPHQITLAVQGTRNGRPVSTQLQPIVFGRPPEAQADNPATPLRQHQNQAAATARTGHNKPSPTMKTTAPRQAQPMSPVTVMFDVLLINLVFVGAIVVLYRKFRHKLPTTHQLEELTNE